MSTWYWILSYLKVVSQSSFRKKKKKIGSCDSYFLSQYFPENAVATQLCWQC